MYRRIKRETRCRRVICPIIIISLNFQRPFTHSSNSSIITLLGNGKDNHSRFLHSIHRPAPDPPCGICNTQKPRLSIGHTSPFPALLLRDRSIKGIVSFAAAHAKRGELSHEKLIVSTASRAAAASSSSSFFQDDAHKTLTSRDGNQIDLLNCDHIVGCVQGGKLFNYISTLAQSLTLEREGLWERLTARTNLRFIIHRPHLDTGHSQCFFIAPHNNSLRLRTMMVLHWFILQNHGYSVIGDRSRGISHPVMGVYAKSGCFLVSSLISMPSVN